MKKLCLFCIITSFIAANTNAQNSITVRDEQIGTEETFDLPEGMTYDIDSLLNEWNAKNYLSDDECEGSDYNPEYNKEEYISRLNRLPNVIETPYNEVVKSFIDKYCTDLRETVSYMLGACNFYIPIFEEALEAYNLPLELKYLPIIESSLNPLATSKSGATGLWQFIITTAKKYGLEVNSLIDERCDPYKSSYAAANYLKDLYDIFGDWTLAIAAFNYGPSGVTKAIHRAGEKQDYWQIYPYLPEETRSYVPAFIAANYVMNYYCEHNICPMTTTLPTSFDTITVNRDVHFDQITALCNVKAQEIKALNPQYRTGLIPGSKQPCTLCLPTHGITAFLDLGDSVYNYKSDELLTNRTEVKVSTPAKAKSSAKTKTITVRKGETLSTIAKRYGTTVNKLKQLNGMRGNTLKAGQKLRVK